MLKEDWEYVNPRRGPKCTKADKAKRRLGFNKELRNEKKPMGIDGGSKVVIRLK